MTIKINNLKILTLAIVNRELSYRKERNTEYPNLKRGH